VAIELHPLDQFKIEPIIPIHIGGVDASFTNSALFMVITIALASAVVIWGSGGGAMVAKSR
jgi:F-type H+-transporting ATPase subunit a